MSASATSHTPLNTRNAMLKAIHAQLLLTYIDLGDGDALAHRDAVEQEAENYRKANKATYRNLSISCLSRLKKRPVAVDAAMDTGTLDEELKRSKAKEEAEKGRLTRKKVERYISKKDVLYKYEYVVDVPAGIGGDCVNEEGSVKKCERRSCGVEYLVKAELDEVSFWLMIDL